LLNTISLLSLLLQSAERRKLLLKYVKEVQPALIEQFVERGPPAVVAAMKNTITNMLWHSATSIFHSYYQHCGRKSVTTDALGEGV